MHFKMIDKNQIILGHLTQMICDSASWGDRNDFPLNQVLADEIEILLKHLKSHGQFERYLPNLRGKLTQRDGVLAEARVAYFLTSNDFQICEWEPKGALNTVGEFLVQRGNSQSIFVEVKGRRWEGELTEEEKRGLRRKEPRKKDGEARAVNPLGEVMSAADKALKKFLTDRPNLLFVDSGLLFRSPGSLPLNYIEPKISADFQTGNFSTIGGIVIFETDYNVSPIDYTTIFVKNDFVTPLCAIPTTVADFLLSKNK